MSEVDPLLLFDLFEYVYCLSSQPDVFAGVSWHPSHVPIAKNILGESNTKKHDLFKIYRQQHKFNNNRSLYLKV